MLYHYMYYRGSHEFPEVIEVETSKGGKYQTTYAVNVQLLKAGIVVYPGGDGTDINLRKEGILLNVLKFLKAEREKRKRIAVKSLYNYRKSGMPCFDDFFDVGDYVTDDVVQDMINWVPSRSELSWCTQCGEPVSHEWDEAKQKYRPTFITFHQVRQPVFKGGEFIEVGGTLWQYDGNCFGGETKDRTTALHWLDRMILAEGGELH